MEISAKIAINFHIQPMSHLFFAPKSRKCMF